MGLFNYKKGSDTIPSIGIPPKPPAFTGRKIRKDEDEKTGKRYVTCERCGARVGPMDEYCRMCGIKFADGVVEIGRKKPKESKCDLQYRLPFDEEPLDIEEVTEIAENRHD